MRTGIGLGSETSDGRRGSWKVLGGGLLLGSVLAAGVLGCRSDAAPQISAADSSSVDPADANMAPVDASQNGPLTAEPVGNGEATPVGGSSTARYSVTPQPRPAARVVNESQGAAQSYVDNGQQAPAPVERQTPESYGESDSGSAAPLDPSSSTGTQDAQALSDEIYSDVDPSEQAQAPPPPLPVYDQPPAPADDYLWTPGYWGYQPAGYYWVPGAWCAAPYVGALWTPGWWGPYRGRYAFHHGYWGRHIGFYGGIPYGFGYYGTGYHGGYWNGNHFAYNRAVTNVNVVNVHNVYNRTVIVNNIRINNSVTNRYLNNVVINNRASYNGGRGGVQARPVLAEAIAFRSQRIPAMTAQQQNQRAAATNRAQYFQQNGGRPQVAVAARPFAADRVAAPPVATQTVRLGQGNGQGQGTRPGQGAFGNGQRPGVVMAPAQRTGVAGGVPLGGSVRPGVPQPGPYRGGQARGGAGEPQRGFAGDGRDRFAQRGGVTSGQGAGSAQPAPGAAAINRFPSGVVTPSQQGRQPGQAIQRYPSGVVTNGQQATGTFNNRGVLNQRPGNVLPGTADGSGPRTEANRAGPGFDRGDQRRGGYVAGAAGQAAGQAGGSQGTGGFGNRRGDGGVVTQPGAGVPSQAGSGVVTSPSAGGQGQRVQPGVQEQLQRQGGEGSLQLQQMHRRSPDPQGQGRPPQSYGQETFGQGRGGEGQPARSAPSQPQFRMQQPAAQPQSRPESPGLQRSMPAMQPQRSLPVMPQRSMPAMQPQRSAPIQAPRPAGPQPAPPTAPHH